MWSFTHATKLTIGAERIALFKKTVEADMYWWYAWKRHQVRGFQSAGSKIDSTLEL